MRLRRRLVNERHPDNELPVSAMAVLALLHRDQRLTIGELAAQERVQPPSMTRLIDYLADAGYVTREQHVSDGRRVVVHLTDAGRDSVIADRERRDAWLSLRLAELDAADLATLAAAVPILERLANS